jgi:hypothetical protein
MGILSKEGGADSEDAAVLLLLRCEGGLELDGRKELQSQTHGRACKVERGGWSEGGGCGTFRKGSDPALAVYLAGKGQEIARCCVEEFQSSRRSLKNHTPALLACATVRGRPLKKRQISPVLSPLATLGRGSGSSTHASGSGAPLCLLENGSACETTSRRRPVERVSDGHCYQ